MPQHKVIQFIVGLSLTSWLLVSCTVGQTIPPPPTPMPTVMPSPMPAPTTGQTRVDPKGVEQVWVPAGSFLMGTSDEAVRELLAQNPPAWVKGEFASEQPQHAVRLTGGYWLDKYEVTNAAFQAFVTAGGYTNQAYWSESGWQWLNGRATRDTCASQSAIAPATHPCVKVTWYEAEAYARWRGGRLPTEAEWEYAARGLQALSYPWGNTFDASQTNVVNSKGLTPVGSYPNGVSWVGAHDMAGNAMEWVQDWLAVNYYQASVSDNPTGPATGRQKVEKGGWWGSNPFVARSAYRHFEDPPDYSDEHIGFRIVSQ